MNDVESLEKAKILKESLKIVNELATSNLDDMEGKFTIDDFDYEKLQVLIKKAKSLKKSNLWKLT
jgi:hypothetical protein